MENIGNTGENKAIMDQILHTLQKVTKLTDSAQNESINKEKKEFSSINSFKQQIDLIIQNCTRVKEMALQVETNQLQAQHKVTLLKLFKKKFKFKF